MYQPFNQQNAASPPGAARDAQAPTAAVAAYPVTYGELRERAELEFEARQFGQAHRRNLHTALNGFMKQRGAGPDTVIGPEMSVEFDTCLDEHKRWLGESALSERTIRDRGEFLCQWQRIYLLQRQRDVLPADFGACIALLVSQCALTTAELAERSGIPFHSLRAWFAGEKRPWRGTFKELGALESALGVPQGTLARRLPARRLTDVNRGGSAADSANRTDFQRRMSDVQLNGPHYRLKSPSVMLELEWQDLLEHKTAIIPTDGLTRPSAWRVKPLAQIGQRLSWAALTRSGQGCPTAQFYWSVIASYLGYLALDKAHGGLGQPAAECQSLTLLADPERIIAYIEWRRTQSENKLHKGMLLLVTIAASLVKPKDGYMWQRPEWASHYPNPEAILGEAPETLGASEHSERWRAWCEKNWKRLLDVKKNLNAVGVMKKARDPKEALGPILAADRPVDVVLEMISRMEAVRPPPSQQLANAVLTRDILLFKLLISNPLRCQHFSTMVYRPRGRGNIYQTVDGAWRLRFDASDFKNARGAAHDDYDVAIPKALWHEIEYYLTTARPVLLGTVQSSYFFISAETGRMSGETNADGMWTGHAMGDRVRKLWRIYSDDVAGYGPHGFRSIVATDYLKRFPGDYPNVARLLHDRLETVLREYAHLGVEDGLRRLHAYVESYWNNGSK